MARNYAALLHEYLEEMDILSDAEFGRLCRALLAYSAEGREGRLEGAEKVLWKRVKNQEDRFQKSYEELTETRRQAGKKGAAKRWRSMAEDGGATAEGGGHANTETETETKTKTETDLLPPGGGRNPRGADPAVSAVLEEYLRLIPSASRESREELAAFAKRMGPEVCGRAVSIAADSCVKRWDYIRAILLDKQRQGVRCLADWDALEKKRERAPGGPGESDAWKYVED